MCVCVCVCWKAFAHLLENLTSLEAENALAKSHVAQFAAGAVSSGVVTIAELASPLTGGAHYPLFLLCLQQLAKLKDKDWLVEAFHASKLNLQSMLPGTWTQLKASIVLYDCSF
jgi:translation initiation factor 4G